MATLVELSSHAHQNLKVIPSAVIQHMSQQHVLQVSAVEIAHAATCFPVFITRNNVNGAWTFSAMTSFNVNQNLFVKDGQWQPVYQPSSLRTYPLFLMQSPQDNSQYCVGFDPESTAFSETEGKPLFVEAGQASEHLAMVSKLLETDLQNMQQSAQFAHTLENLNLLKPIDINVHFTDSQFNTIKGLHTIDEDAFRILPADELAKLNDAGYLMPIHAMLMSIFQLNVLINKNNALPQNKMVSTVKMEVSKTI